MNSLPGRILAYLLLVILCGAGPVMLLIAAGTGVERALFIHSSLSADGVIVSLRFYQPSTSKACWPIFRFTAKNGRSFTVTSNIAQSPSPWQPGDPVRVLYQQDHPENAHIDSFAQLWEPQAVAGIVGGVFSCIPAFIFLRRRRSKA
jgi:Protein of unknown function (DUF3592)